MSLRLIGALDSDRVAFPIKKPGGEVAFSRVGYASWPLGFMT